MIDLTTGVEHPAWWGPWYGVPASKQHLCAVNDCTDPGKPQVCLYDGRYHHHGCIHYDCPRAEATGHGLTFRPGWGLVCDRHYASLKTALDRKEAR